MLVRTLCWYAAVRPRHTWMALMVDECSAMPMAAISALVRTTFMPAAHTTADAASTVGATAESSHSQRGTTTQPSTTTTEATTTSLPLPTAPVAAAAAPGSAPEERAHAWVVVARLLCERGDWARAAAVVEGLPVVLQQPARLKAVRDEWSLPRSVVEAWRASARKQHTVAADAPSPPPTSTPVRAAGGVQQKLSEDVAFFSASLLNEASSTAHQRHSYTSYRKDELVRNAYNLRRSAASPLSYASTTAAVPAASLIQREQHAIVAELRRRGAVAEALQCIVNWQRRQLLRPDAEATAARVDGGAEKRSDDHLLFDGLGAVKSLLFPGETSAGAGGATTVFAERNNNNSSSSSSSEDAGGRVTPPHYSAQQLACIREAVCTHPALVARCLRDRAVGDRLLRHTSDATVASFVFVFLRAISAWPGVTEGGGMPSARASTTTRAAAAAASASSTLPFSAADVSSLEAYWRALAALLLLLHPYWCTQSKAEKEKLLQALNGALDATRRAHTAAAERSLREGRPHSEQMPLTAVWRPLTQPTHGLSDKCLRALKATVESVCSPLLHHEPQVRFLRLGTFSAAAQYLSALGVAIPNALMQCLFLCMADSAAAAGSHDNGSSPLQKPDASHAVVDVVEADGAVMDTKVALHNFLSTSPADRWLPALAMLHAAHRRQDFRVTAAHERALLSGLQSVSITRTWPAALRVVAECERAFAVTPDERTLPTLLLNLKQQSWQDAFRVLRWVPGGEAAAASPAILRDLQLVALKHASWEVPLRLMTVLQERHADGFMNYVYCLCAAARGGQAEVAFEYFCSLRRGRGRHTAWQAVSPFNELTVAVAAVAMLEFGHDDALHYFSQRVLSMQAGAAAGESHGVSRKGSVGSSPPELTADGKLMAQAADVAALLNGRRHEELSDVLTALPVESLSPVLRRFVALRCLLGMGHLNAPIRLVFDVLGSNSSPLQQCVHREFLDTVAATQVTEGTFETRQRGSAARCKHLFIPVGHQRRQRAQAAAQLGTFVKAKEADLPPHVVQSIAETMVEEGVGAEYMTAALL
jgi:hypothetical protein